MTQAGLILAGMQTRYCPRIWLCHFLPRTFPSSRCSAVPADSVLQLWSRLCFVSVKYMVVLKICHIVGITKKSCYYDDCFPLSKVCFLVSESSLLSPQQLVVVRCTNEIGHFFCFLCFIQQTLHFRVVRITHSSSCDSFIIIMSGNPVYTDMKV